MHNIKLVIAYDGTAYLGWQKTKMGMSVEEILQKTIEKILQHPTPLQAASRTDAGVHAEGQVVNFLSSKNNLDLNKFRFSLNNLLPKDILVLEADEMPVSFHPTIDCQGKEYHYFTTFGSIQRPHHRLYSWHVPYTLNLNHIKESLSYFIGSHDFSAFCNAKKNRHYTNYIREVQCLELHITGENQLSFLIRGNHFLYKMVRNIVGTLIYVGRGKLAVDNIPIILGSGYRPYAGITAPAHGLFLHKVFY